MNAPHDTRSVIFLTIALFIISSLSACNLPFQATQGLMTWIDQPLNGAQLPLAPLIIQAHAADTDGIASIEFLVAGELIASVSRGGARLEEAAVEWTPPKPGVYIIHVRAIDTQGNTNARTPASVQITAGFVVSSLIPSRIASPGFTTPTSATSPTSTPTPAAAPTETPSPFAITSPTVAITTLAPKPTITPVFVTKIPPAADLIPPIITDLSVNPSLISAQKQCGHTPATVVIQAHVSDAGGITRVYARIPGEGEFDMMPIGEGYYQVTPGPFATAGTLTIFVQALDNAGNSAVSAPLEVQVVTCLQ